MVRWIHASSPLARSLAVDRLRSLLRRPPRHLQQTKRRASPRDDGTPRAVPRSSLAQLPMVDQAPAARTGDRRRRLDRPHRRTERAGGHGYRVHRRSHGRASGPPRLRVILQRTHAGPGSSHRRATRRRCRGDRRVRNAAADAGLLCSRLFAKRGGDGGVAGGERERGVDRCGNRHRPRPAAPRCSRRCAPGSAQRVGVAEGPALSADFTCGLTRSFLGSGRVLANAGNAAAIVGGVGCVVAGPVYSRIVLAGSLLFWFVECWFAVRVAIDGSLFGVMAGDPGGGGGRVAGLVNRTGRPLAERSRGALALWRKQIAALAVQLAALAAGIILRIANI